MLAMKCLNPVLGPSVEVLILGSFPSVMSLATGQYYANPRNQFWRLLGTAIRQPLERMEYPARLATLLAHGIGLWDVIAECDRGGGSDAKIRNARANDFTVLPKLAPKLQRIGFNGRKAERLAPSFDNPRYATVALPSSSSAFPRYFALKCEAWLSLVLNQSQV